MNDLLLQSGLSNIVIAGALALAAWGLQHTGRFPRAAHLLWLAVLVKLVTPAFFTVPVIELPAEESAILATPTLDGIDVAAFAAADGVVDASSSSSVSLAAVLLWIWLAGSAVVLAWSLLRVVRFDRLLRTASVAAPAAVQQLAARIGRRLGLVRMPTVYTTSARVSPLVWWVGGRVRVVIPAELSRDMDREQLEWVLAHELGHVRRRDHMVRWLEWLACILCWWNPIAWWARKNLRTNEEVCCDALVLATLNPNPRTYANSLLTVVEFLSAPALPAPAFASGMSGGSLERRFKMIVSAKSLTPAPRWLRALALLCVLAILPLGIAQAGDGEKEEKARLTEEEMVKVKKEIWSLVEAGKITEEEARERWEEYLGEVRGHRKERDRERKERGLGERIFHELTQNGFTREQAKASMNPIEHIVHEMKKEGERYELNQELRNHLVNKVGLADGQIDTLEDIAREICTHHRELEARKRKAKEEMAAFKKKIHDQLQAGEITEEEAEAKMKAYLEFVQAVDGRKRERRNERHEKMAEMERKLHAAVEKGELTEEEAKAKWEAWKKELESREKRAHAEKLTDKEIAGVKKELRAAVKAGRITEEEAKERLEEYLKRFKEK